MSGYVVVLGDGDRKHPIATASSMEDGKRFCQEHLNGMYADGEGAPELKWRRYLSRGSEFMTGHETARNPFDDVYEVWSVSTTDKIRLNWIREGRNG